MSNYAAERGESKLAQKLQRCGHWLVFRHYYTVDKLRLDEADFCKKHLLCPLCAIRRAIQAARGILEEMGRACAEQSRSNGRIITVFGSAGKRDPEKRRLMAEISTRLAEYTVLTAEDPRTESLDDILAAMAAGCTAQGGVEAQTFWRIPDRGQAIYFALGLARPQDFVLVCGKGHEQSMCFITTEYPWDDIHATEAALDAFLAGQPMPDLGLPTFDPNFQLTIGS